MVMLRYLNTFFILEFSRASKIEQMPLNISGTGTRAVGCFYGTDDGTRCSTFVVSAREGSTACA